jgi:hypothetical protein
LVTFLGVPLPDELTITVPHPSEISEPDGELTENNAETIPLKTIDAEDQNTDNKTEVA